MTSISIPESLAEAQSQLADLGGLIQAKKWQRAAIVAAFVDVRESPGGAILKNENGLESPTDFAKRGIIGLRSSNTVQHYAENWLAVRERPKPGDTVDLDGLPGWPPRSTGIGQSSDPVKQQRVEAIREQAERDGAGFSKAVDIASNPKAMAAAIKGDPTTRKAAERAIKEADLPDGDEYDDQPEEGFVADQIARDQAHHEELMRSADGGHKRYLDLRMAADDLARYGHDQLLRDAKQYVDTLVESLDARELTPEMFR